MYNIERFSNLPTDQRLDWYNKANQLRLQNRSPRRLSEMYLSACIWYGESLLEHWKANPPCSFEELQAFIDTHTWLLCLKREWITREFKKQQQEEAQAPLPLLLKSVWDTWM